MSEPLRLSLRGKNAKQWNRLGKTLVQSIVKGAKAVIPAGNEDVLQATQGTASDAVAISTGWLKAKVDKPSLENEKTCAEIEKLFEEAKERREKTESQKIQNESSRLDLAVKRVKTAIALLGLMHKHFVQGDNELTLLLTNEDLEELLDEVKVPEAPKEVIDASEE